MFVRSITGKSVPGCYYLGMQAAGFVLVGGLSARMGQDKALLSAGSLPLVVQVAGRVAQAAGSVTLVGHPQRYRHLGLECIRDLHPQLGPLAGIEAALDSLRGDFNLIAACDVPDLPIELLHELLRRARQTGAQCVVTRDGAGTVHPLCAVYRSACLPAIQEALKSRRLRLMDLIQELGAAYYDFSAILANVNTPQEWSTSRKRRFACEPAPLGTPHGN